MLLMRWIWIDRIIELERGKHVLAVKNVSLAEEVVHDHFPAQETAAGEPLEPLPVMPASLLIEGMAQTAGILVGHLNDFKEKVILAKITKARFDLDVLPGQTVFFDATIERIDRSGASTKGEITVLEHVTGTTSTVGVVELIFSHIDQNRAGVEFPEHNFVFTDNFKTLLITSNIT